MLNDHLYWTMLLMLRVMLSLYWTVFHFTSTVHVYKSYFTSPSAPLQSNMLISSMDAIVCHPRKRCFELNKYACCPFWKKLASRSNKLLTSISTTSVIKETLPQNRVEADTKEPLISFCLKIFKANFEILFDRLLYRTNNQYQL